MDTFPLPRHGQSFVGRGQRSWFCKAGDDRGLISFRAVDAPLLPRLAELQRCTLYLQSCPQTSLQTSRQSPRCRLVAGPSKGHHHQQQHYSFVPDLPASATSSPRPPDIACLFPESVALGQDARPRSGVRPRSCPRPRCVPRTAVAAWFKPSCQGDLLSGQVRGVAWLALLRGGAVAVRRRPPRSETPQLAKAFTVGRAVSA